MTEALRNHGKIERRSMSGIVSWVLAKLGSSEPRQRHPREEQPQPVTPERPHYIVEHGGWSSVGWSEEDPTPDEALEALASLGKIDFSAAMDGLRKSGEERLKAMKESPDGKSDAD